MEQLIFLGVVVVIGVVNAIIEKRKEGNKKSDAPVRPQQQKESYTRPTRPQAASRQPETDAERTRRFLEALGLPSGSPPPTQQKTPSPAPQPAVAQKRASTPSSTPQPPPLPAEPARAFVPRPQVSELSVAERAALARIKTGAATSSTRTKRRSSALRDAGSLAAVMRDGHSLRRAIVLREILDSPPGLKSDWGMHKF